MDARPPEMDLDCDEAHIAICDVLAAWRAADRELAALPASDPDAVRVEARIVALRDLHHRLFAERARAAVSVSDERGGFWSAAFAEWLSPTTRLTVR